jgi:hypothetical protein
VPHCGDVHGHGQGLAFLIDERMAVSASSKGGLLLRIDPDPDRVSGQ